MLIVGKDLVLPESTYKSMILKSLFVEYYRMKVSGSGPVISVTRLDLTRTRDGVGRDGERPFITISRLAVYCGFNTDFPYSNNCCCHHNQNVYCSKE